MSYVQQALEKQFHRSKRDQSRCVVKRVEIKEGNGTEQLREVKHAKELVHENLVRICEHWIEVVRASFEDHGTKGPIETNEAHLHSNGILSWTVFAIVFKSRAIALGATSFYCDSSTRNSTRT